MGISRSNVNQEQYSAPEFQKSGFNLGYKKYSSFLISRIHVSGFQHCMPGDKISGQNHGNFTFNRLVTPMVAPVDVAQYNMFIPYRALDRTFERAFAPNKNNAMSANWSAPTVTTRYLVEQILKAYFDLAPNAVISGENPGEIDHLFLVTHDYDSSTIDQSVIDYADDTSFSHWFYKSGGIYELIKKSLTDPAGKLRLMAQDLYLEDALLDIWDLFKSRFGDSHNPYSGSNSTRDFTYNFFDCLLTPFLGRYSYFHELGYKYIRPNDLYRISNEQGFNTSSFSDFVASFDDTPQNEYALRAMYVIWYEHFRNVDLEPVSSTLPYWRDFGSTSIFDMSNGGNLLYLIYRIRSWYKDPFTSAQIDDLSRHVFAPISVSSDEIQGHIQKKNNYYTNADVAAADGVDAGSKPAQITLAWRDQLTDTQRTVVCPIPTNVNDVLSSTDLSASEVYGLDLNTLRQSQMLERYLKRNYLFGDEYQDRMLAHYNSRVSDLRINRPEILSRSINVSNMEQQISNVTTEASKVGDRTATGTLASGGDMFTTYCEEFGVLINLITFMPRATYDGICPQNILTKVVDYPLPEFATNNEEFGRIMEIADSAIAAVDNTSDNAYIFGRYPAYHAWRSRVDSVGGMFLDELQECTFRRFWGLYSDATLPKLNYFFIHCRPNLNMFANSVLYDSQIYGDVIHECFVERVLPTPVEVI